jgi:hypothetical protein
LHKPRYLAQGFPKSTISKETKSSVLAHQVRQALSSMLGRNGGLTTLSPQNSDCHTPLLSLVLGLLTLAGMVGCSSLQPSDDNLAVRSMPVIPGRPARVFIFAGLGDNCEPIPAPRITITEPPAKGDVSFVAGQETTIQYSAKGTCAGRKATGTGIYYTARAGREGTDRFSIIAKLPNNDTATRTFEVTIAK